MTKEIPVSFSGSILGASQVNKQITKGRLRIFYEGENRNGSYMSPEFSARLLATLPYTPVVGIYDKEEGDFLGHSPNSNDASIYGIVPQEPNLMKEAHVDEDGITRYYYTCDVYLYTGRLEAANQIIGKQHSLELDPTTISGNWEMINGKMLFKYTGGEFLGLSVLGDDKTPCFEGSAFYELVSQFDLFMQNKNIGGSEMEETKNLETTQDQMEIEIETPKTSEEEEEDSTLIQEVPETVVEEETNPSVEESAEEVQTEPVEEASSEATKDAEESAQENEVPVQAETEESSEETAADEAIAEVEVTVEEPLTEEGPETVTEPETEVQSEAEVIEAVQEPEVEISEVDSLKSEISEKSKKIVELENEIATLKSEAEQHKADFEALKDQYEILYAKKVEEETSQKEALLTEYSAYLDEDTLKSFDISKYSVVDLEKDLLFASKPALMSDRENSAPISAELLGGSKEDGVITLLRKQKERK